MLDDAAAPTGQPAQEPEEPPPPIETPIDLWDPAGDPDALERAAAAWEQMATQLAGLRQALDARVQGLSGRWTGQARQAFEATWAGHAAALSDGEQGAREVAAHLRELAGQIRQVNGEVHAIYLEVAATAGVSILAGLVSFGVGAAAGAARVGLLVRRAIRLKRALTAFLAARRAVLAATRTGRILRFTLRFSRLGAQAVAVEVAVTAVRGQDPFDADSVQGYGLAAVLGGLPGGRALGGAGRALRRRAPDAARHALRGWRPRSYRFGEEAVHLTRERMEHFLRRHHPDYWDGSTKKKQSFFDRRLSVRDLEAIIGTILNKNRDTLREKGTYEYLEFYEVVDGVKYKLAVREGKVAQFYPEIE